MQFIEYYVTDKNGNSNCIIRTFCKLFNKDYETIEKELIYLSEKLQYNDYKEITVFETYLENNNFYKINNISEKKIKDLNISKGNYAIFCYDKKDFYHMIPIIEGKVYDRNMDCLDLYTIEIYEERK